MQLLVLFVLFLFTLAESSSVESESDLLSSLDIIVFEYSHKASQHCDCPRVGDRVAKAEEARVWQTAIPDARIKEIAIASGSRALQKTEQYKWINESSSDPLMKGRVILGMRKPSLDGSTAPVKMLHSKSRHVNQDALSAMLPQLEHSKDRVLEWMARTQVPITSMTPKITDPLLNHRFRVPPAENYHPRAFKHPYFTAGDLVAWMALAAESRQKSHEDAFRVFKLMAQSFLPGFSVSLGAVPTSSAGKPTRTVYLHRSFQYVPAGADLAFYFDGNRGKFLKTQEDSIVLNRPEGIVDGQQHAALVLSSDAGSLEIHLTKADIAMRKTFCEQLKKALAPVSSEVQAVDVVAIRSHAARLERGSFLETQRKVLEVRPTLLTELLPAKLVRLVIDYFSDDTYPFIVSTHKWSFKSDPGITVDSARLYVRTNFEGVKGLNHSSANLKEDESRYVEFGSPQWIGYLWFTSSHDGKYVSFSHMRRISTAHGERFKRCIKWLIQGSELEGGGFKQVTFDVESLSFGSLSRNGQLLFFHNMKTNTTHACQIVEEAGKNPAVSVKLEFNGMACAVSGKGNRAIIANTGRFEIHDIGHNASKFICRINTDVYFCDCALNDDGSEAAFINSAGDKLRIVEVDKVVGDKTDQPAIVSINIPEPLGRIARLAYSDGSKLHVLHYRSSVSLFDPSTKTLIPIETPHDGQPVIKIAISPNADYFAILQRVGEEEESEKTIFKTIVKRKFKSADWKNIFGCDADEAAKQP